MKESMKAKIILNKLLVIAISGIIGIQILFCLKAESPDIHALLEKNGSAQFSPETIFCKETSFLLILIFAFLYGILISLTPSIYPMIPITAAVVQTNASNAMWYNFLLSLSYVLGTSITYATLGLFVALSGAIFGQWLVNPWFILFIIIFFLYIAGSMFGIYKIYMPKFLTAKASNKTRGSLFYSFLAGLICGTITSPYLTPALAALLLYVANAGNPLLGFLALFAFSIGMGILLLIIGTSSATLLMLPTSTVWMIEVKRFLGFLLLGVCIYFLSPIIQPYQTLFLIAGVILTAGIYYLLSAKSKKAYFKILFGILLLILGGAFIGKAWILLKNHPFVCKI